MDAAGTHAPVAEEKILDSSSRLRSSARLGFASTSSTAAACRIARRKRKKRRRQRRNSSNDDVLLSTTVAGGGGDGGGGGGGGGGGSGSASGSGSVPASGPPAASGSETSGNPEEEASLVSAGARAATGTDRVVESGPAAIQLENGKQKSGRVAQINNQSGGGSGSARAAASSVGSGITLLNRRAGKRSSRRCNATSRRNAMTMDLQKLITEVHARPAIWDQKNVNYHNRDVILKMWREIARACEVSTDVAKSKWKHLRDNFRNELKKSYRGKCEGNGNEHDSKWVWFKSLFFLRDQMNSRVIGCALSQNCSAALRSSPEGTQIEPQIDILEGHEETQFEDLDADSCHSLLSNDDALHHVMPPPKLNKVGRKRTLVDAIDNDYPELDRKRFESLQKRLTVVPEEEDDTYHFLMSVRNPLRSLPLDRQMFIRLKIQELVYNEINSQNQQQQSRGYDGSQDVKPLRPGHAGNSCGSAGAGNDSGEGEVVNDMSNSASLLPNCATEGSSGDAFFT